MYHHSEQYLAQCTMYNVPSSHTHIRRIKTEEKANVVFAVSGMEWIQFLAALAIFHQDDLK